MHPTVSSARAHAPLVRRPLILHNPEENDGQEPRRHGAMRCVRAQASRDTMISDLLPRGGRGDRRADCRACESAVPVVSRARGSAAVHSLYVNTDQCQNSILNTTPPYRTTRNIFHMRESTSRFHEPSPPATPGKAASSPARPRSHSGVCCQACPHPSPPAGSQRPGGPTPSA